MMEDYVQFGCRTYGLMFVLLLVSRGMDILSTWIATPNMVLEGNPIAKKLGWRWGVPLNLALCFGLAFWPLPAIVIGTTSLLVAARNFQSAWLMRSLGRRPTAIGTAAASRKRASLFFSFAWPAIRC